MMQVQILRLPKVIECVGMRRSSIYAAVAAGTFPAPVKLGPRSVGWPSDQVERWIQERIAQSRKAA